MKSNPAKQLEEVRKDLKAFWSLLNSEENVAIYGFAHNHGIKLSDEYTRKVTPIAKRLTKFIGIDFNKKI